MNQLSDPLTQHEANNVVFAARRGGSVGIGNVGAVAFRFDHDTTSIGTLARVHRETGVPASWAHFSRQRELQREKNNRSWGSLQNYATRYGFEPWSHGATHGDQSTQAGYRLETVVARAELEAYMPACVVEGFTIPGVGGSRWDGFDGKQLTDYTEKAVGRLVLEHYGCSMGRLSDTDGFWPLDGQVKLGMRRFDIEQLDYYQVRDKIEEAQDRRMGLAMMLHPKRIGYDSRFMSVRHYTSLVRWIANQRDAGKLASLTVSGLAVADSSHSRRLDLITNGDFTEGDDAYNRTGWSGRDGNWRVRGRESQGISSAMSTRNERNATLRQTVDVPEAVRGGTFTLSLDTWASPTTGDRPVTVRIYLNDGHVDRRFKVLPGRSKPRKITVSHVLDRRLSEYKLGIDVPDPEGGTLYVDNVKLQAA